MIESEKSPVKTIDRNLVKNSLAIIPYKVGLNTSNLSNYVVEEYPTSNGLAVHTLYQWQTPEMFKKNLKTN